MWISAVKLVLSVTVGAGIGSIVATRITFWQFRRKGLDIDNLSENLSRLSELIEEVDELLKTKEGQYLLENVTELIIRANKTLDDVDKKGLMGVFTGGQREGKEKP